MLFKKKLMENILINKPKIKVLKKTSKYFLQAFSFDFSNKWIFAMFKILYYDKQTNPCKVVEV